VVVKANGSVSRYRLLPVHHDPDHATIVSQRLQESSRKHLDLPPEYQISKDSLPVMRDQGERGTCTYFATVGVIESYYLAKSSSNKGLTLSEECLTDVRDWMFDQGTQYKGEDQPGARPDPDGDYPSSIIKTITRNGVPLGVKYSDRVNCAYDGTDSDGVALSLTDYLSTFSSTSTPTQAFAKGLRFDFNTTPSLDQIKASIVANHPVEIGLVVYTEYMSQVDWRFDPKADIDSNISGGHAVMLTGYKTANNKTVFTFKNSWGENWGAAGYGTLDDQIITHSWGFDPNYDFILSLHD
jgi:C1A family cysteine protease